MIRSILLLLAILATTASAFAQQKIVINHPNRSGSNWPLFLAKDGGYYAKYGLDVELKFGVHPAGVAGLVGGDLQMVNSSLEQLMQAASKDGSLVLMGSALNKGMFALMAKSEFPDVKSLKGKRVAIGQVGDAPYGYMLTLMAHYGLKPRDVQWIPVGADVNARAAALAGGRADASLLTAPAYFRMEEQGYKALAHLSDTAGVFASTTYLFKKSTVAADPGLPEKLIKAHSEAIKRFYEDKAFAVKTFLNYDKAATQADTERVYDLYFKPQAFERVPYVLAPAVKSVLDQQADPNIATQMKTYDWKQVIDNTVVERLVKQGFFEQLFGKTIKAEQDRKAKLAFRK